jgi:nicotinate-nucleotide pyrophosphorylase (carboxylating)
VRWRSRRRSTPEHDDEPTTPAHVRPLADDELGPEDGAGADDDAVGSDAHGHVDDERSPEDDAGAEWLEAVAAAAAEQRWDEPHEDLPEVAGDEPPHAPAEAPAPDERHEDAVPGELPRATPPARRRPAPVDAHPVDPEAEAAAARDIVRRALAEDLDLAGDVTAEATVPPEAVGTARLVARAEGVVAGLALVGEVYDQLDPRVAVRLRARDGDAVTVGQVLAEVEGPLRSVLTGERTALNLVTHLSGVATVTARYVAAVADTGCVVRDTRKTTPGLRLLEKAAVRAGGGVNHRTGLSDALLVKDNHVAAAGGVAAATHAALAGARGRSVQIEVDSLEELEAAVAAGARDVLLDNFDVERTRAAVERVRELEDDHGRILLESSGGLDLERVRAYAQAGVDRIAVGALTHSAPQLDLALDLDAAGDGSGGGRSA